MTAHEHIDELAELYALGTLSDAERNAVDSHARSCAVCAQRIGEAEALIAQTAEAQEPPAALGRRMHAAFTARRTFAPRWGGLVAAAFVLGLLPGVLFAVLRPGPSTLPADREQAIAAMVNSHFSHAQFAAVSSDAPKAKVIYGHGAPWRYFVAQTTHAYTVEARTGANMTPIGTLHVSGDAAELFIPNAGSKHFELVDGTRVIARVTLP